MRAVILVVVLVAGCGGAAPPAERAAGDSTHMDRPVWTGDVSEEAFAALHRLSAAEVPPLEGDTIDLADGTRAYLALPEGPGPHPAVLVIHEWWGLNDHIRHWADRLAADGYAALAVDLYGGRIATEPDDAMALMREVDEDRALTTLRAAVAALEAHPAIDAERRAVVGWCFGGGWSLAGAIAIEGFDAVVVYYGRPVTEPERLRELDGPLLGIFANEDTAIPPPRVDAFAEALEEAGVAHEILRFDAVHAFANPSNARYDQAAASEAWEAVRRLLARTLRPSEGGA